MSDRRYDRREPCAQCPYRKDAPLAKWHADHFVDLVANDADMVGRVYLCHNADGNVCAGWALDQRDRNVPCVALRIALTRDDALLDQCIGLTDGGHPRYDSIAAMCHANFPRLFPIRRRR